MIEDSISNDSLFTDKGEIVKDEDTTIVGKMLATSENNIQTSDLSRYVIIKANSKS